MNNNYEENASVYSTVKYLFVAVLEAAVAAAGWHFSAQEQAVP